MGRTINSERANRREFLQAMAALGCTASLPAAWPAAEATLNDRMTGDLAPVHDPCIIKADGLYHVFCTGQKAQATGLIPWRTSADLVNWTLRGKVFDAIPAWAEQAIPGIAGLWAPDIAYFNDQHHLYYACSTFGSNRSAIGLVTNRKLDPQSPQFSWQDRGLVVASQPGDDFNAIDPNHLQDREGKHWLSLGSFWSGIKLIALDPATGKPAPGEQRRWALASRPVPEKAPGAIEAPFIIEREGYYYLFVSFDYCCRGIDSSYYMVVGRSRRVTGPYVGRDGRKMSDGYGTLLLEGNRRFHGPGHNAVLRDKDRDYLVYHAYDAQQGGRPTLRISPIAWADGWPTVTL